MTNFQLLPLVMGTLAAIAFVVYAAVLVRRRVRWDRANRVWDGITTELTEWNEL
jgi:hypothetical protein